MLFLVDHAHIPQVLPENLDVINTIYTYTKVLLSMTAFHTSHLIPLAVALTYAYAYAYAITIILQSA